MAVGKFVGSGITGAFANGDGMHARADARKPAKALHPDYPKAEGYKITHAQLGLAAPGSPAGSSR